jgi:GNAT superfamily N-acetyltransferase
MAVMVDMTPDALSRAIEDNGAEFLVALGRAGGAEERDDGRVWWTIGGSPIDYHNCVVRADLGPDAADAVIEESLRRLRSHGVPGTWHVGPSMRPADLGDRLRRHGFAYADDEIGMAMDLERLADGDPGPVDLSVVAVRDDRLLRTWTATLARGFGEGEREAAWVGSMYSAIGLGDDVPWRHYLALLDGQPVATASLFVGAGVAGIYFVFAVAEARRRGIGAAITLAGLRDARAMGLRTAVLGSSRMGYSVYRRLGFVERCRIGIYEWTPDAAQR